MKRNYTVKETDALALLLGDTATPTLQLADPDLLAYYRRLEDREYLLATSVDESINDLLHWVRMWNKEDDKAGVNAEKRRPITILLDTPGGDTMEGLTVYSVLKTSQTPIRVVTLSKCASIGMVIMLGANRGERYAFKNSTFLIHDGYVAYGDSLNKTQDTLEYNKKLDDRYRDAILANTNISSELYEVKKRVEWYISAEEALELGLIDHIVTDLSQISEASHADDE